MKKVIFFMIDSLMPQVLDQCIRQGTAPALKFFKDHGMYWDECTTVFPTMTATVDCSLITGEYPDGHKIPALIWYEPKQKRLVNYTNGALPVIKLGFGNCANDVIYQLNEVHLSQKVRSIYEELHSRGKTSGSINLIAHRSINKHKVKLPFLLWLATGFCSYQDISGPEVFTLGAISRSRIDPPLPWKWDESIFGHYGINDRFAIRFLNHLIQHNILPDFTMVYLPDNDHQVHLHPHKASEILSKVDQKLQHMLNQFPRWEDALEKFNFIITGDHGQTIIGETPSHNIHLEDILVGTKIASYGESIKESDEIVIANNERMTYLYPLQESVKDRIIELLSQDERIDIVGWKEDGWVHVRSGTRIGELKFTRNGPWEDVYANQWCLEGELELLDIKTTSERRIFYGEYPDVLMRLYTALFSQDVPLIACTAKSGYEFKSAYAPTHLGGGSHGSLHKTDSTIPLIISGNSNDHRPFQYPRLIDLKNYILSLLTEP